MWKLLLAEMKPWFCQKEKKSIMTNFMDQGFFLSAPDSVFCFLLISAGRAHFLAMLLPLMYK